MGRDNNEQCGRRPRAERWSDVHDDDDDADVAELDDRLHRAFSSTYPASYEAATAYDDLRPAFVSIRRRQLLRQSALTTAAAAVVLLGGAAVLARLTSPATDPNLIAGPVDGEAATSQTVGEEIDEPTLILPAPSPAESANGDGQQAPAGGEAATPQAQSPTSTVQPDPAGGTGGSAAPTAPSLSTEVPTSAPTPTTSNPESASTATVFASACGSVSYTVDGRDLALVEAIAGNGGQPDIKSAGPYKIEVSFEGGGDHCEVKIEWKNGTLVTEDENESSGRESE